MRENIPLLLVGILLLPIVTYFVVKAGTLGYLKAIEMFERSQQKGE